MVDVASNGNGHVNFQNDTAAKYYDSSDADNFYYHIWGGKDIHVGLYKDDREPISDASHRTVEHIISLLAQPLGPNTKVLDLGAGYGGAARFLSNKFGCHVTCLNISQVQNKRNEEMSREAGFSDKVKVVWGTFEALPFKDNQFDVVWSQDSFIHSDKREDILREAHRVLKPGGEMVFTDLMLSDTKQMPDEMLQPILTRINLTSIGSVKWYRETAEKVGFKELHWDEHQRQMFNHYTHVLAELNSREQELLKYISADYIAKMKVGLNHWIKASSEQYMTWGVLHLQKK